MDQENKESQPQSHSKHNTGAADLEKVTDFVEEKEISGDNLDNAITAILNKRKLEAEQKIELERRLASVKVKKEDVDLICHEFEITKAKAERILKEHDGDLKAALTTLVNA